MHTHRTLCIPNADFMHTKTNNCARAPARSKVVETFDHGAGAVHPDRPSVAGSLAQLHPDTAQEHHASVPSSRLGLAKSMRIPSQKANGGTKKM
jgi:hypothetical protein